MIFLGCETSGVEGEVEGGRRVEVGGDILAKVARAGMKEVFYGQIDTYATDSCESIQHSQLNFSKKNFGDSKYIRRVAMLD